MQLEPGLGQTEFDGPVAVLAVHQSRPLEMKLEILKQKRFFLLKKCKGAICEKRHLLKDKQSHTIVLKGE